MLKPGARKTIEVSQVGGRSPGTCAIIHYFLGILSVTCTLSWDRTWSQRLHMGFRDLSRINLLQHTLTPGHEHIMVFNTIPQYFFLFHDELPWFSSYHSFIWLFSFFTYPGSILTFLSGSSIPTLSQPFYSKARPKLILHFPIYSFPLCIWDNIW